MFNQSTVKHIQHMLLVHLIIAAVKEGEKFV